MGLLLVAGLAGLVFLVIAAQFRDVLDDRRRVAANEAWSKEADPRSGLVAIGTVFGVVTMGFSVGGALAPPLFGWVADLDRPQLIFWASGAVSVLCILSVYGASAVRR